MGPRGVCREGRGAGEEGAGPCASRPRLAEGAGGSRGPCSLPARTPHARARASALGAPRRRHAPLPPPTHPPNTHPPPSTRTPAHRRWRPRKRRWTSKSASAWSATRCTRCAGGGGGRERRRRRQARGAARGRAAPPPAPASSRAPPRPHLHPPTLFPPTPPPPQGLIVERSNLKVREYQIDLSSRIGKSQVRSQGVARGRAGIGAGHEGRPRAAIGVGQGVPARPRQPHRQVPGAAGGGGEGGA
jgi:hypothetical protein